MSQRDPVQLNVDGVKQLVESPLNKTSGNKLDPEGVDGVLEDVLSLDMTDEELLGLSKKWIVDYAGYEEKIKKRQEKNLKYYLGKQNGGMNERDDIVPSNLIFDSEETFIPAALAKNPEPVTFPASNSPNGDKIAKDIKTMLQYHADVLVLRRKLALLVRHWSIYFIGVIKHGWDKDISDISSDVILPNNLVLDINGSVDVYGNYTGKYLGERKSCSAQELIDLFENDEYAEHSLTAEKKAYIIATVDNKLGSRVTYTEWWTNEYCFYTYKDVILDKHKNQFWNYDEEKEDEIIGLQKVKGKNHFGRPQMPYTFLSVFSLGKTPHDDTSLIEQNIPNQDLVNKRITQIDSNLDNSNNSLAVSAENFNNETAKQAATAIQEGRPILVPRGKEIGAAIQRLPATQFPNDAFNQLRDMTERLRSIYGTLGISAAGTQNEKTVRGKIITSQQDTSRIGGGIGDALEQLADNIFNWWVQLYYVFYDDEHFAAVLGQGRTLQFITLRAQDITEKIVVSVAPNSMKPKDEITEMNQAMDLWQAGALDPLTLFEKLNDKDPKATAAKLVMWKTNPQQYEMTFLNQQTQTQMQLPQGGMGQDINNIVGQNPNISTEQANPSLSQVPINNQAMPQ